MHMREIRNAYKMLVGKTKVKRPLGRPRRIRKILKCIIGKQSGSVCVCVVFISLKTGNGCGVL
jgi:hypothetical protein